MSLRELKLQTEDKEIINNLLEEIGNVIARNNNEGLELHWTLWAEQFFGTVSNYGSDMESEIVVPEIFYEVNLD